jgi:hypothetical protein
MEQRYGVPGTIHDGIFFTELTIEGDDAGAVSVEVTRQNANLFEVKAQMAAQARARGADVITQFTYGQKKNGLAFWRWDSEHWYGRGRAVRAQPSA